MLKIILDLFIILILFRFILYFATKIIGWIGKYQSQSNDQINYNNYNNKNSVKDLIQCNSCGVYIAIEDSIKYNGKNFCCKEHVS